jgi:AraC-like DNA-binding protein
MTRISNIPVYKIKTKEMKPLGFDIIDLVGRQGKEYDSTTPHRHTFYELFFFTHGTGIHEIDFRKYKIEPNSVHFVSPGMIHRLLLNKCRGYVLCFTEDFISLEKKNSFSDLFPFYDNPDRPFLRLDKLLAEEVSDIIRSVINERKQPLPEQEIMRAYLNILLLKIRSRYLSGRAQEARTVLKEKKVALFRKYINEHFLTHKRVNDYAGLLNITPNHLNALCKKHEGRTATNLILERILLESKRLLYATHLHVKEIAYTLNFGDVAYFNRFFKKQTGQTPVQYRNHWLKNR